MGRVRRVQPDHEPQEVREHKREEGAHVGRVHDKVSYNLVGNEPLLCDRGCFVQATRWNHEVGGKCEAIEYMMKLADARAWGVGLHQAPSGG